MAGRSELWGEWILIYKHRIKRACRCEAIRFTSSDSVNVINRTFGIRAIYDGDSATLTLPEGAVLERGDYVVTNGLVVAGKTADWFECRWKPDATQMEIWR